MNIILESALSHGATSGEFYLLLQNYGIWSRYFGCSGYKAHSSEILPTAIIDDDTAMLVESAEARPAIDTALRHINASGVRSLLKIAESFIYDDLIEYNKH